MATRVTFQSPLTGRFISADDALVGDARRRVYVDGQLVSDDILRNGRILGLGNEEAEQNWTETQTDRTLQWTGENDSIDLTALQDAEYPSAARAFKVVFKVQANPDYPRGYSSSEWMTESEWPPSLGMGAGSGAVSIARIMFDTAD